ncbi:universal stress protein, partial [Mycolicibacterium sp. CBMA 361]
DLLCLGSLGIAHATGHRLGSTAATLATSALCPVAIVRNGRHWSAQPQHVVVEVDESADSVHVLDAGVSEARLRGAPLTVLATSQTQLSDVRDETQDEKACARLDKRLTRHRRSNPDIEFNPVAVRGSTMNYLDCQTDSIQLLVVGRHRRHGIAELVGATHSVPHQINCSVLICQHRPRL